MAQRNYLDEHDRATESELYLPAGAGVSFIASRFERVWGTLFNHHVGPRN
ncbi:hypothetical protein [Halobellus rufus]|nr:hypothetical protein [Halobellus rufus]